jgi:hypothetical protein
MSKIPYTPEQMKGKFITCFVVICCKRPHLDCVRHKDTGLPYLYNSEAHASFDQNFDAKNDDVIPASEYFERVHSQKNKP